jgi:hypothetical protein
MVHAGTVSWTETPDLIVDGTIGDRRDSTPRGTVADLTGWAWAQAIPILALDALFSVGATTLPSGPQPS